MHKSNLFSIFDQYHDYNIKGVTHQDRVGNISCSYNLSFSTPLPPKEVTLHSTETKKQLIELLAEELLRVFTNAPCKKKKKLVITSQSECPVQLYLGIKIVHHSMSTTHEEPNIIIPQQVKTAIEKRATCVKVISADTDVFVLSCISIFSSRSVLLFSSKIQPLIEMLLTSGK